MAKKKINRTTSDLEYELEEIKKERSSILNFKINIKCKTKHQKEFLQSIMKNEVSCVLGCPGSGKSLISIYGALQLLKEQDNGYNKIIFIYPPELDKSEALGFLSGDLDEKTSVYAEADKQTMEKIFTISGRNDGKEIIQKLISQGMIEFRPSTYLRGFTFDNSIILISEAQNFSKDAFLKILTRIGSNSKYIISGDVFQTDAHSIKSGKKIMGLQYAIDNLKDVPGFGIIEFGLEDILRNDIIVKILKRWIPEVYGNIDEEEQLRKAEEQKILE